MLPVPGSMCSVFETKWCRYLVCSQYFGLMCCGYCYLQYSEYFEVQYCGYLRDSQESGFDTMDTPCTSRTSGLCTAGTARTASISCVGTVSTVLAAPEYSQYAHLGVWNIFHISTICAPFDNYIPFFRRRDSQMVPRVGVRASCFRGRQLE